MTQAGGYDYVFCVDGLPSTGFGHVARCLAISAALRRHQPAAQIAFWGDYAKAVRARIEAGPSIDILPRAAGDAFTAAVGFYDTMSDPERPEAFDAERLATLQARTTRTLFLASGLTPPDVADAFVVGYQPGEPAHETPNRRWGLAYAPVESDAPRPQDCAPEAGRLLIALGGGSDPRAAGLALEAGAACEAAGAIDLLQSPVAPPPSAAARARLGERLTLHRGVPSVAPLLSRAAVVLASYGNLGFEALAAGKALCLVAQKEFQAVYAERLQSLGAAVNAGRYAALTADRLAAALTDCFARADALGATGAALVDNRGIDRLAELCLALHTESEAA